MVFWMAERNVSAAFIINSSKFALDLGSSAMDAKHDGWNRETSCYPTTKIREGGWVNTNTIIPDLFLFLTLNAAGRGGGGDKITAQRPERRVVHEEI